MLDEIQVGLNRGALPPGPALGIRLVVTPMTAKTPLLTLTVLLATAALSGCLTLGPSDSLATLSPPDEGAAGQNDNGQPGTRLAEDGVSTMSEVTVTLLVHTDLAGEAGEDPGNPDALPGTATCDIEVESGANAGEVLDAGVQTGCIADWDYDEFDDERFVNSVDNLRAEGLTCLTWPVACQWWEFRVDDAPVGYGIDEYSAEAGSIVEFFFHTA